MKFASLTWTWFDLLLVALLAFGIFRGRKRGISEELLDLLQWLCIVVVGALVYAPFGGMVARYTGMGTFYGYVVAYGFTALMIKLTFTAIKRAVGEKLVHSDAFGAMEYYLGMMAGALRYMCMVLFAISFLHAKYISDSERAATAKMQAENFGSISFPTMGSLQHTVFYESPSGKFIKQHLREQLMQPAESKGRTKETLGKWREQAVNEVLK